MIITCPNCQTKYQLAQNAIGSAGRKVQCAQCQQSWNAKPEPDEPLPKPKLVAETAPKKPDVPKDDPAVDAAAEAALDAAFEAEEAAKAAKAEKAAKTQIKTQTNNSAEEAPESAAASKPKANQEALDDDGALDHKRHAMLRRHAIFRKKLPLGRIRKNARMLALGLLVFVIGGGLLARTEIVRQVPDMAGFYAAIGLPVNVNGLEFINVETLRSMQNGVDVMVVTGQVLNISGRQTSVPPIAVSIHDEEGNSVYSWNVTPLMQVVAPNDTIEFEARLNSAPVGAQTIRLTFSEERRGQ